MMPAEVILVILFHPNSHTKESYLGNGVHSTKYGSLQFNGFLSWHVNKICLIRRKEINVPFCLGYNCIWDSYYHYCLVPPYVILGIQSFPLIPKHFRPSPDHFLKTASLFQCTLNVDMQIPSIFSNILIWGDTLNCISKYRNFTSTSWNPKLQEYILVHLAWFRL